MSSGAWGIFEMLFLFAAVVSGGCLLITGNLDFVVMALYNVAWALICREAGKRAEEREDE
jgi:hypothetical protein